jgi:hypothetical protein
MVEKIKINILNPDTWIRGIFMILFGFLSFISRLILIVISVLQFILLAFRGSLNENLKKLGETVSTWSYQAFLFLTYNTDEKPFPFSDWPDPKEPIEKISASSLINEEDDIPSFVKEK